MIRYHCAASYTRKIVVEDKKIQLDFKNAVVVSQWPGTIILKIGFLKVCIIDGPNNPLYLCACVCMCVCVGGCVCAGGALHTL